MSTKILAEKKFEGDARMLCDAIEEILRENGAFNEIVSIRTTAYQDFTKLILEEETLSDGSTVFNLELETE